MPILADLNKYLGWHLWVWIESHYRTRTWAHFTEHLTENQNGHEKHLQMA